ncbi:DeoR/GlpR family DNA-binding transcription regulator [Roseicella aerolata]|uniref:DeoR/GlpR family DNA-binding transcription regulator n=1 Tax=Roseicella aerolata TaxID=2883479 RepID=A0A9X1LCE9_9PROT|nr:DeoR/GlpR family DNA-binding transcription regulator [Roseicella aerolata]MCB4823522.1 DeoR/GlpR family DNA-binding transcription regulator [Roseicella aerolata]
MRRNGARRDAILAALAAGKTDVDGLAARFGVSPSTIRRDLQHLSARRAIARTYGGAILAPPAEEQSLGAREGMHRAAKAAIAEAALALVAEGETLILDGGSTVEAFGRLLRGRRHRVITNNLPLIPVLADAPGIELVVLGGAVRPISMSTTGPLAEAALRSLAADRLLTSADGLVPGFGLCEATLDQISLKSLMMQRAVAVTVLADASKLGRSSQPYWAPLPARWTLVTEAGEAATGAFLAEGARVVPARQEAA